MYSRSTLEEFYVWVIVLPNRLGKIYYTDKKLFEVLLFKYLKPEKMKKSCVKLADLSNNKTVFKTWENVMDSNPLK